MKKGLELVNYRALRRKKRVHSRLKEVGSNPRLVVFRSNKYINAQIVDDVKGKTVLGIDEKSLNIKDKSKKIERAKLVGQKIAEIALKNDIKEVIFDRNGYKYHGRVKSLADGAREKGLKF